MKKLFLFKSDHERESIADIIIDVELIRSIRLGKRNNKYVIFLDFDDDHYYKQWFVDKNNFDNELHALLTLMGLSEKDALAMKDQFVLTDHDSEKREKEKKLQGILDSIKESMS